MNAGDQPVVAIDATLFRSKRGGDSTYWEGLIQAFSQVGSGWRFLLLTNRLKEKNVPKLPENFIWIDLPMRNNRWLSMVTMPLIARKHRANIFHTQYNLSPFAKNGITTIHDVSFFVGPEWFSHKDRMFLQKLIPGSAKRAKKVITVSETSKKDILRFIKIPEKKVHVTPLAPREIFVPQSEEMINKVCAKYNITKPYLFTLGSRWARKNLEFAVEVFNELKIKNMKLVIAGDTNWQGISLGENIVIPGYVPDEDLPALYSGASLLIFTSKYEGFGLPVVESFACGTPVVCSSGGALREVAGDAGIIKEGFDKDDWARSIAELLSDSSMLSVMCDNGLKRAKEFSWQKTAQLTLNVYKDVLR